MSRINYVIKRNGAVVPFNIDRITNAIYRAAVAVGSRDRELVATLAQQVVKVLEQQTAAGLSPTVEEIQDTVELVLIENRLVKISKAYILYRAERARHRQRQILDSSTPSANIPWAKIWHSLDWAVDHGVDSVKGLNERIARSELADVIHESEDAYHEDLKNAADMIAHRVADLKLVIITGPSSSGKTTSTIKVGEHLRQHKLNLVTLNVDNYFFDLEQHPKDEFGDYDFETPQALDLALISEHLSRLVEGKQVLIPFYDFRAGKRYNERTPMQLKENELILIDSLHGLYPQMTSGVPDGQKFKLYLEPLLQMKDNDGNYVRWTDIRLMRRMLRDAAYRAYDPNQTLLHWHYVRASEMLNIIPFNRTADYIVSSAMPYEVSVYKPKLNEKFSKWVEEYHEDPLRADAFERAVRVAALLDQLTAIEDDAIVPKDSVIREFIGGSALKY